MAKNYTFNEAVEIIAKGTDLEAIAELGKRFPVLAHKIAVVAAKAGESFTDLMSYMPEHLTANKVNTVIKNAFSGVESDEDADEDAPEAVEKAADVAASDYESMSGKELVKLLRKAGKGSLITSKKKADLVALCNKELGGTDADDEVETEENPYEGKTAMELFKECKKRGIKAEPKNTAKFYAELLAKDDAKADTEADAEDADDADDDWDEEEVEEAPKKETKKASKKETKKATVKPVKKAEPADDADDDDDWDI